MSRPNGDCLFLDATTRLCSVYAKRPQLCRDFPMKKGNRHGYCPSIRKGSIP
jgi:Fe-S-cluster containining protein